MFPYRLETEYEDGFVETDHIDFTDTFNNAKHKLHEKDHGKLVALSCIGGGHRFSVDMRKTPAGARPIHYVKIWKTYLVDTMALVGERYIHYLGYQYNDENGKNHKAIKQLPEY